MKDGGAAGNDRGKTAGLRMGILPDLLAYHLRCAHVAVFQHFNRTLGVHGISGPQFGTLLLIEANPGVSQSSIAEALRFDRSTLVQIVDRLEDRGPGQTRALGAGPALARAQADGGRRGVCSTS